MAYDTGEAPTAGAERALVGGDELHDLRKPDFHLLRPWTHVGAPAGRLKKDEKGGKTKGEEQISWMYDASFMCFLDKS